MTMDQKRETPLAGGASQNREAGNLSAETTPKVDKTQAERFLALLDEESDAWAFRTFPEIGTGPGVNHPGSLDDVVASLEVDNGRGRGVFVVVNEGGTLKTEITRVRAVFADFDPPKTAALPASLPIEPHIIVESSPGRHHAYWLVDGLPVDEFTAVQKAIITAFGSDPSVNDLPRVMRLPGFLHRKGQPHCARIVHESGGRPYTADEIRAAFPPVAETGIPVTPQAEGTARVVSIDRHADALTVTGREAREVVFQGRAESTAWAAILAERERGRWTRLVPDDELRRMFNEAIAKCRRGEWVDRSPKAEPAPGAPKAKILHLAMLRDIRPAPIDWLIEDHIPRDCIAGVIGASWAGKTFVTVGMCGSIATGLPWYGHQVKQGGVIYLCGEGQRGLRTRFDAWAVEHAGGLNIDDYPIALSGGLTALSKPDQLALALDEIVEFIEAHAFRPELIVIDTLARAMAGGNENSAEDMGSFIAAKDALRMRFGCTVISVHHIGHDKENGGRGRGSSARYGALDAEFLVSGNETSITVTSTKAKDWASPKPLLLQKIKVPMEVMGPDGELDSVESLALRDSVGPILEGGKREKARELRAAGQTFRAIGVQIGVSKSTVAAWFKEQEAA